MSYNPEPQELLKSLHQFLHDEKLGHVVRCDANPPSIQEVQVTTTQGDPVRYSLVCVPVYLLWNLPAILADLG